MSTLRVVPAEESSLKNQLVLFAATIMLVGSIRAVTASDAPLPGPQASSSEVCYDDLGNTRYVRATEPCKPGERRTKLIPQSTPDAADDPQAALQKQVDDLIAKVSALQAQITDSKKSQDKTEPDAPAAQKSPSTTGGAVQRVVAPFEVVDSHGKVILRVSEKAEAPNGARLTLGPSGDNKYGLRVFNEGGQLVSGVGHGADGGGLVVVSDGVNPVASMSASGHAISVFKGNLAAASMKMNDNGGELTVYHNSTPVTFMTATRVGGSVVVARNDGMGLFGAQVEDNGGGSACVNRISGDGVPSKTCLGIGLPMR